MKSLRGSAADLAIQRKGGGDPGTAQSGAVQAPAPLPWLWCDRLRCNAASKLPMAQEQAWMVGPEWATLVVCHDADGFVPRAVEDAEEAEAEAQRAQRSAELASFPLGGSSEDSTGSGKVSSPLASRRLMNVAWGPSARFAARPSPVDVAAVEPNSAPVTTAVPPPPGSSAGSDPGSLRGRAAAVVGREFGSLLSLVRRRGTSDDAQGSV